MTKLQEGYCRVVVGSALTRVKREPDSYTTSLAKSVDPTISGVVLLAASARIRTVRHVRHLVRHPHPPQPAPPGSRQTA